MLATVRHRWHQVPGKEASYGTVLNHIILPGHRGDLFHGFLAETHVVGILRF